MQWLLVNGEFYNPAIAGPHTNEEVVYARDAVRLYLEGQRLKNVQLTQEEIVWLVSFLYVHGRPTADNPAANNQFDTVLSQLGITRNRAWEMYTLGE